MVLRVICRFGRLGRVHALIALLVLLPHAAPAQESGRPVLLLLGDSLTAGYGLSEDQGFPAQLRRALKESGWDVDVRNAGVSGDTTAGGLARLDWTLAEGRIDAALVELGANDALRGLPPETAKQNLDKILTKLQAKNIKVLLAGMLAPPNLGEAYSRKFEAIYPDLARKHDVPLYSFFLEGVAAHAALNQADGIHPNAQGVAVIVRRIEPKIADLLRSAGFEPARPGTSSAAQAKAPEPGSAIGSGR